MKVTGTIYAYSYLCYRKVWFSYHNICKENDNQNVAMGALVDDSTYKRFEHNINIDNISIDYIKGNVIYEVKKSDKQNQMAINQVKYYLYTLYLKGVKNMIGCINYPLLNKKEIVILSDEDRLQIEVRLSEIEEVLAMKKPPKVIDEKICKSCAYYQLCYI
jgi:CRISPR-associated exonuclease Cas4